MRRARWESTTSGLAGLYDRDGGVCVWFPVNCVVNVVVHVVVGSTWVVVDVQEVFYQLTGTMTVETKECGARKPVDVREGEVFLLPSRVPHSPQVVRDNPRFTCPSYTRPRCCLWAVR